MTQAHYAALAGFRYALRRFLAFSERAARQAGLTPRQHQGLLAIKGFPPGHPVTVGALAERLQVRHHSAVGLVDRLHADRLIVREPGRDDRRRVHLRVTRRGEAVLARLSRTHRAELRRLGPELEQLLRRLEAPSPRRRAAPSPRPSGAQRRRG